MSIMTDWMEPFEAWCDQQECEPKPLPEGLDLDTVEGMGTWLSYPANWVRSDLFVLKWDGMVPRLARNYAWNIAPGCPDRKTMIEVAIYERRRRRERSRKDDSPGQQEGEM